MKAPSAVKRGPDGSLVAAASTSNRGAEHLRRCKYDIMSSRLRRSGRREPPAVLGGRKPEAPIEGAAKRVVASKADGGGDRLDLGPGSRQVVAGGIEPQCLDLLARSLSKSPSESPAELTRTQGRACRELLDRQVVTQMRGNPRREIGEPIARSGLESQRLGELPLPSRALHVDDQIPRHRQGELRAVVLFDQRQREIDGGRNPGGCV